MLALSGCQTKIVEVPKMVFPSLDAFRPNAVPTLIEEPQTDADLLSNSVAFEFLLYDWQDYAEGLERYIQRLSEIFSLP